ncbi:MAG: T9SS type A sorting domain-containing protein [Fluviicola sp.]
MKNLFLSTFFIASTFIGFSQLMRSEVYNFSVGDYFGIEYRAGTWYGDEQHTKDYMYHILSKQLSSNGDTAFYSAQRQIYLRPLPDGSGGYTPSSLSIDTFTFSYTHLNQAYNLLDNDHTFGNYVNIYWQIDTSNCDTSSIAVSAAEFCPGLISQQMEFSYSHMNYEEGCSGGEKGYLSNYKVYSHAGGPYGGRNHPQPNPLFFYDNYDLFFFSHNAAVCGGSFPNYFLNVEDPNLLKFSVFPNPANDQLTIEGVEAIESYVLMSADGKQVDQPELLTSYTLDVSHLNSGIYLLRLTVESGKTGVVRFVK